MSSHILSPLSFLAYPFFFFNDTATTEIYTLSLHDALPILGIGLLWAQAVEQQRYLARLSAEIQRLDPEVKTVERMAAEAAGKAKLVGTLRSARTESVRALPVLQDLTQILPTDAWLQSV